MEGNKKHINIENWKRFFNHQMSEREKTTFKEKVNEDDFTREAMEGFDSIKDNDRVLQLIKSTQKKILAKEFAPPKKRKTVVLPIYKIGAVAASVALLVGSVIWINNSLGTQNQLAEANIESEQEDKSTINQSTSTIVDENLTQGGVSLTEEESDLTINDEISTEDNLILATLDDIEEEPQFEVEELSTPAEPILGNNGRTENEMASGISREMSTAKDDSFDDEMEEVNSPATADIVEEFTLEESDEIEYKSIVSTNNTESLRNTSHETYQMGLDAYQSGDYSSAIGYFNITSNNQYNLTESNYYNGLCYYYLSDFNKSLSHFDFVISSNTSYSSSAKWYKADILLKKGKVKQAKKIYQDLMDSNSSFKEQAQEILDSL